MEQINQLIHNNIMSPDDWHTSADEENYHYNTICDTIDHALTEHYGKRVDDNTYADYLDHVNIIPVNSPLFDYYQQHYGWNKSTLAEDIQRTAGWILIPPEQVPELPAKPAGEYSRPTITNRILSRGILVPTIGDTHAPLDLNGASK